MNTVSPEIYGSDYYLQRCGGVEFFHLYKADILKPMMQVAVNCAALKPGMSILDFGCGRGELVAHLTKKGFDATGIDYSKDAIDIAQTYFPEAKFICGDLLECRFPAGSFDRIFFLSTIEHLYDDQISKILEELSRLLKPNGRVIITTCTNSLYFKTWTYGFRRLIVRCLNKFGMKIAMPSPPRSGEDVAMHINEQNFFSLKRLFSRRVWNVCVEPRANPKLCLREIYGEKLPLNFPMRSASAFKQALYKVLMAIPIMRQTLSRSNVVVLTLQNSDRNPGNS